MDDNYNKFRDALQAVLDGPPEMEKARDLLRSAASAVMSKFCVVARVTVAADTARLHVGGDSGETLVCMIGRTHSIDPRWGVCRYGATAVAHYPYSSAEENWSRVVSDVEQSLCDAAPLLADMDFEALRARVKAG